jgi:hypothetical protein
MTIPSPATPGSLLGLRVAGGLGRPQAPAGMGVGLHAVAGWQRRAAEAAHEASAGGPGHQWTTVTAFVILFRNSKFLEARQLVPEILYIRTVFFEMEKNEF